MGKIITTLIISNFPRDDKKPTKKKLDPTVFQQIFYKTTLNLIA